MKTRTIAEIAVDLRKRLHHTQQSWAHEMGWGISTATRFEHGAQPSARMMAQMLEAAHANGLADLADEIQLHLNVALGPNSPIAPDAEMERFFVAIARRIFQDRRRHTAFLKFAAPEIEKLKAENALRKEHADRLFAGFDAAVDAGEKMKKKGAKK